MAKLRLLLLGPPTIEADGKPVPLGRRKVAGLLVYLAATARRHTRDSLAHLLYPRHGRDRAFADLRQSLSVLKAAIGAKWLDSERGSVGLAEREGLSVDLREFRRLAAGDGEEELAHAAELVRGPFLSGFYMPDSPAFEEWQTGEAEALQREQAIVLDRLVGIHEGRADYARAIEICGRLLRIDPLDEATVRRMMRLCASAGRRAAALHEYEAFRQSLDAGMGQKPDAETEELRDRILSEAGERVSDAALAPATPRDPPAWLAVRLPGASPSEAPRVMTQPSLRLALADAIRAQRESGGSAQVAVHVQEEHDPEERVRTILRAAAPGCVLLSATAAKHAGGRLAGAFVIRGAGRHRLDDLGPALNLFQLVHPGVVSGAGTIRGLDSVPHNLPFQPTRFIGRRAELAAAATQVRRDEVRLLTFTGPGGTGKTRLATQVAARVAREFDHGAFVVDLAAVSRPSAVAAAIIGALGVAEGPDGAHDTLVEHLRPRRILLILDNYEQLLPAGSEFAADLVAACPGLKLLVTSRAPLNVRAEHVMRIEPMGVPEASLGFAEAVSCDSVALFSDCADRARQGFRVDRDNVATVTGLCRCLDGLPLAIELAAARLHDLGLPELARGLESRLATLTDGPRDLPERQRALRSELDWSYELLSQAEQRVFRRLAVFVGEWDEAAVSDVCAEGTDGAAVGVLRRLVRKSLVQSHRRYGALCYRLLETVREYALERLVTLGEDRPAFTCLADYAVRLAEHTEPGLFGPDSEAGLDRLDLLHGSIQLALEWMYDNGLHEPGSRLAAALGWFWFRRAKFAEGKRWLERYEATAAGGPAVRARIAYYLGWMEISAGNRFAGNLRSRDWFRESVVRFRKAGDASGEARSLAWVGNNSVDEPVETRYRMCDEGIALARRKGDPWSLALCLKVGITYQCRDDLEPAARVALAKEAIAAAEKAGDPYLVAETIHGVGDVYYFLANHESERWFSQSLQLARKSGYSWLVCDNLWQLAQGFADRDQIPGAKELYREGLRLAETIGARGHYVWYLRGLAWVAKSEGREARRMRLLAAADALESSPAAPSAERAASMTIDAAIAYALSDED